MLLDHSNRWNELPNIVKITADLSACTKGLEWLDATDRTLWRRIVLVECKNLFQADIAEEVRAGRASNRIRGPEERSVNGGGTPWKNEAEEESIFEEVWRRRRQWVRGTMKGTVVWTMH